MPIPKIEERTLYPLLVNYLKSIGFKAVGESKITKKSPDILFQTDSLSFVIEVKIGKPEIGLKATAQAYDYARKLNTENIIILVYPETAREEIAESENVEHVALNVKIHTLILTEFWTESLIIEPKKLFQKLKKQIVSKKVKIDFNTTVALIGNYVKELNTIIFQKFTNKLINEVVNKLDLFSSIGEFKNKEIAKRQIVNLASYLLFNQLLFYHIFNKKAKAKIPDLKTIKEIKEIQYFFNAIKRIDYQSIYRVNILGHIPENKIVIDTLNEVIKAINILRAEQITHDLAGRFFHDLIPFEVRKVLAAFYTHPISAELLAGLTIGSYKETIIDPACGSGTLLVAAYRRKLTLYKLLYGYEELNHIHKSFIEEDITGIDIMPFAAHITAINLTMQNIEQETNKVRIATLDSLELARFLDQKQFRQKGIEISPYTKSIQLSILDTFGEPIQIDKKGAVSPEGRGAEFKLKPTDAVIMNPPFSDREKMPSDMRDKIKKNPISNISGNRINLWGYFLVLADSFLKRGGTLGAVIPMNIARGKATEKIRNFIIDNYHIKYFIKTMRDLAFSEGSAFIDILLIAEKKKPKNDDLTGIIFLKKSIREFSITEIDEIISKIEKFTDLEEDYVSDEFDIIFLLTSEIKKNKENLMPILGVSTPNHIKVYSSFINILEKNEKITKLKDFDIREGFHASPAGISELTFITRPYSKDRIGRAYLLFEEENDSDISITIKNTDVKLKINKKKIIPALRSLTGVDKLDIENMDFFIKDKPQEFNKILNFSKLKNKKDFEWDLITSKMIDKETNIALARRFNPHSPNTHFFAFYSSEKFIAPHTFKIIKIDEYSSKYQCLLLNSVIGLLDIIRNREQTTGQYTDIMESDLKLFHAFNFEKLSKIDIAVLDEIFETIKNVQFPSILTQLKKRFKWRVELDTKILEILGFSNKEINIWIPKIYDALVLELEALINLK
ncbi:MAG: N-6 DNA methylase [Promethearchaeota archaeon]